jgi:hypothetical protein
MRDRGTKSGKPWCRGLLRVIMRLPPLGKKGSKEKPDPEASTLRPGRPNGYLGCLEASAEPMEDT